MIGGENNDLSDPNQCVSKVHLKFKHQQRTELTIDLMSPSGQIVRLVGPYDPTFQGVTGTLTFDVDFVPCSEPSNPFPGTSEHFNTTDNWGFFSTYSGRIYYPWNYCLESFDSGTVNGTWSFIVHDHEAIYTGEILGYSIEFCDGTSIDCDNCTADAGIMSADSIEFCLQETSKDFDINLLFLMELDTSRYKYDFVWYDGDDFLKIDNDLNANSLPVGIYHILGSII
ncbi:MAG: hypothetical protein R2771_14615 [Saprospiraceae bacterium]